jgi:hypothetical protein
VLIGWLCWDILKEAFSTEDSKKKETKVPLKQSVNKKPVKRAFSAPEETKSENIRDVLIETFDAAYKASKDGEVRT